MKQIRKLKHSFAALSLIGIVTLVNPVACYGQGYTISTVAGNPLGDWPPENGGPAINARLISPAGVAVDAAGNLFFADSSIGSGLIRKVSPAGIISTVAGNLSLYGNSSGDGGPATSALIDYPQGIAIDATGNLYIAEYGGNRVRKVTPDGKISTIRRRRKHLP